MKRISFVIVLVLGTQRWSVPLPGGGCLLQTDPVALVSFTTDASGYAVHKLIERNSQS